MQAGSFSYGETTITTSFVYDSTGARVKKSVAGGSTTVYLGKDYDVTGSLTTKYIFLGDRRISTKKSDGTLEFIHDDHISSSNVVTDENGDQVAMLEYDPYGATVTHTGASDPKYKYTGQEEDGSTNLYYYGARYYDVQLGRFISADWYVQDPADPQSFNRYAYARNNPIVFTDPTGNFFFAIVAAISAAINAVLAATAAVTAAYAAAVGFVAGGLAAVGITGTLGTMLASAIVGAAVGATLSVLDAAIQGKSIGRAAAFGAIGGAITGGIVGPAGGALGTVADKVGMGAVLGIARVGLGSYMTYSAIKNKSYFSAVYIGLNTIHTATVVSKQIQGTLAENAGEGSNNTNDQQQNQAKGFQQDLDKKDIPVQKSASNLNVGKGNVLQANPAQRVSSEAVSGETRSKEILDKIRYASDRLVEAAFDEETPPNDGNHGGRVAFPLTFQDALFNSLLFILVAQTLVAPEKKNP